MKPARIDILDYSRLLAAVIVLFYHYTYKGLVNGKVNYLEVNAILQSITKYGYLGVDFFFIISGYVIFSSARGKCASAFAIGRIHRLYPSFWVALTLTTMTSFFIGGEVFDVSLKQYLANLTMLPRVLGQPFVDGVYWTLQYEIKFYLLVYSLLLLGFGRYLHCFFYIFPAYLLVGSIFDWGNWGYLNGYFSYFCVGALFYLLAERKTILTFIAIAVCYFISIEHSQSVMNNFCGSVEYQCNSLVPKVVVALFYLFFFCLTFEKIRILKLPISNLIGGVTYPLYLIHAHIGYMIINYYATDDNIVYVYSITFILILLISLGIHKGVEVKTSSFWKRGVIKLFGGALNKIDACFYKLSSKVYLLNSIHKK